MPEQQIHHDGVGVAIFVFDCRSNQKIDACCYPLTNMSRSLAIVKA